MGEVKVLNRGADHDVQFPPADDLLLGDADELYLNSLVNPNIDALSGANVGRVMVGAGGCVLDIDFDSCSHLGCNYVDTLKQLEAKALMWSDLFSLHVEHDVTSLDFDDIIQENGNKTIDNVKLITRNGLYLFVKFSIWTIDHADGRFAVVLVADARRHNTFDNMQKLVLSDSLTDYASSLMWSCKNLISQMKPAESRGFELLLFEMANIDALTNLPNRKMFMQVLKNVIYEAKETGLITPIGLGFLKIDDLRKINHVYGTDTGDALLASIGLQLKSGLRACDLVARIGGAEFAMLLPDTKDKKNLNIIGERLIDNLNVEEVLGESSVVKMSIGMTLFFKESQTMDQIMNAASKASHQAKELNASGITVC